MSKPRIMLAAPKSGSGKTLITCALLMALSMRGKKVRAFKCGPDYIDPMFHQKVLGIPSRNLDLYFTGEDETRALFLQEDQSDVSVIEGVMGLYDGLAGTMEEASSYHLAKVLDAPVILVINARGMGRSLLAEIAGFLLMDHEKLIQGVILNQVSEAFYGSIAPLIEAECKVKVLGYFPVRKEMEVPSRYLGLKLPRETEDLKNKVIQAAKLMETTVDLDALLEMAERWDAARPLPEREDRFPWLSGAFANAEGADKVKIAVAMDEAFCFYYEDNLRLLKNAGAELCYFSPLHDGELPSGVKGILLGGGYPELMAGELAENESMRSCIRSAINAGMPSLAECGGFMYLHDAIISDDGERHDMVGVIHGECKNSGKLVRFGYAEFRLEEQMSIRGHEFHYYDSNACGTDCTAVKPVTGKSWSCGHFGKNHYWSYGHLYYPSNPAFVQWFVGECRQWAP